MVYNNLCGFDEWTILCMAAKAGVSIDKGTEGLIVRVGS